MSSTLRMTSTSAPQQVAAPMNARETTAGLNITASVHPEMILGRDTRTGQANDDDRSNMTMASEISKHTDGLPNPE